MFRAAISRGALEAIRECTHKGWALGSEHFREQIERVSGRRAASKGVGGRKRKVIASDPVSLLVLRYDLTSHDAIYLALCLQLPIATQMGL